MPAQHMMSGGSSGTTELCLLVFVFFLPSPVCGRLAVLGDRSLDLADGDLLPSRFLPRTSCGVSGRLIPVASAGRSPSPTIFKDLAFAFGAFFPFLGDSTPLSSSDALGMPSSRLSRLFSGLLVTSATFLPPMPPFLGVFFLSPSSLSEIWMSPAVVVRRAFGLSCGEVTSGSGSETSSFFSIFFVFFLSTLTTSTSSFLSESTVSAAVSGRSSSSSSSS
mmetsp:Transcript_43129/g.69693  ORF Transcript_43129/g.69693 Transcript_43129/m.69693 type:complete len:220 (+) Transcript_43129:1991-2650(+)